MKANSMSMRISIVGLGLALALGLSGCGKSGGKGELVVPDTPQEAASQLDQAFAAAPADVKANVDTASEAMRAGEYEKAVVALQSVKASQGVTLDQGLAIHGSIVSMEANLIQAMEAGDENAARAYQMLKRMKRN